MTLKMLGPATLVLPDRDGSLAEAAYIVDSLAAVGVKGQVAGGFLRDLHNGVDPKDIDIFVSASRDITSLVKKVLKSIGYTGTIVVRNEVALYLSFCDVTYVMEFHREGKRPVQIIVLKADMNFEDVVTRLDLGICQIGMDRNEEVWVSPAYEADKKQKTMTIVRQDHPRDVLRSTRRFHRIVQRYSGWKLVGGT